jgi:hypothetical protein
MPVSDNDLVQFAKLSPNGRREAEFRAFHTAALRMGGMGPGPLGRRLAML